MSILMVDDSSCLHEGDDVVYEHDQTKCDHADGRESCCTSMHMNAIAEIFLLLRRPRFTLDASSNLVCVPKRVVF